MHQKNHWEVLSPRNFVRSRSRYLSFFLRYFSDLHFGTIRKNLVICTTNQRSESHFFDLFIRCVQSISAFSLRVLLLIDSKFATNQLKSQKLSIHCCESEIKHDACPKHVDSLPRFVINLRPFHSATTHRVRATTSTTTTAILWSFLVICDPASCW